MSGSFVWPGYPTIIRVATILLGGFLPVVLGLIALHDPRTAARFALSLAVLAFLPLLGALDLAYSNMMGGFGIVTCQVVGEAPLANGCETESQLSVDAPPVDEQA